MAAQLQITVRDMEPSATLESRIRGKLAGLERIFPRITSFRVTVGTDHHHLHGDRFSLKLDIRLPGLEIVVTRDHQEHIYVALREVCQAARKQLLEHVARGRGSNKSRRARIPGFARGEAASDE